jgi:predicted RNase H-like HicB family nuclease
MKYPATFTAAHKDGGFIVTFRDIPEAITQGDTEGEAIKMAHDVLGQAMSVYLNESRTVPLPSAFTGGDRMIDLPEDVAAKVLLHNQILSSNIDSPKNPEPSMQQGNNFEENSSGELNRAKELYKEYASIAKDTLDIAWKLAPLALFPAGLFPWAYLRTIHWTGLFQDSAMTLSGLTFLFIAALLLVIVVLLQFVVPSVFLIGTVTFHPQDKIIHKYIANIFRAALAGWVLSMGYVIWADSSNILLAVVIPFIASIMYLSRYFWVQRKEAPTVKQSNAMWSGLGWSAAATFVMLTTSIPLVIILKIASHLSIDKLWQTAIAIAICAGVAILSLAPGFIYLNMRTSSTSIYRPAKFAVGSIFFIFYVVAMGIAVVAPVSSTVLRFSGIYNNEPRTYQVREPSLAPAFEAVGFKLDKSPELTLVHAYLRYGFGGYKLLCADSFDPSSISVEAIKKARAENKPDPGIVAGSHCVSVSLNEVREVSK